MSHVRDRLGNLSNSQLQTAFDRFDLGRVVHTQPASTGNFNQNLFVTTSQGEFVFRGAPHFDWQFPKERHVANLIHEHAQVTVPWPYLYEESSETFGWPFAIMPRLPGIQVGEPRKLEQLSPGDRLSIAIAQGTTLASLHAHSFPVSGDYDLASDSIQGFDSTYADWVAGEIEQLATPSQVIRPEDSKWIHSTVQELLPAARTGTKHVIVHGDFTYHNMAVARAGDGWAVSGLFDLMTALTGDGVADLARQYAIYLETHPPAAQAFVDAYLDAAEAGLHVAERFRLFLLHERLLVRDFAFRHNTDWLDWNTGCRTWLEGYFGSAPD